MFSSEGLFDFLVTYWEILRVTIMVVAVIILVSSIDDLMIDLLYWRRTLGMVIRRIWQAPPRQRRLDTNPEKSIAVMVPAWRESEVIANMVANTINAFDYDNFDIFVGVYANDHDTAREVARVADKFGKVHRADVPHDGPTSKADCLNWLVQNILLHEQRTGKRYDAFLMHDAEDVVHRYGLRTVNWFIQGRGMIQLPVLSMNRPWYKLVACHYMDEFAEFHTKDLPVRSEIAGMTPSAGVATAFSREAILALCAEKNDQPFNTDSLTEDYDVAHRLRALGMHSEFIRYHAKVPSLRKAWFRKGQVKVMRKELVATKEFFPDSWRTSVRQKARWMLGISYLGWRQLGWFGDLDNRYFLFRDRKALLTAPVGALAYLIVLQYFAFMGVREIWPRAADLPPLVDQAWVWAIIQINFWFLVNRIVHRAYFTARNHGLAHVPVTPIRIIVSNLIGFGAFYRSLRQYTMHLITRRPIAWDKTQHSYPSLSELRHRGGRIGDVLLFWKHVGEGELETALKAQTAVYRPIGLQLLDQGAVADEHLAEAFAERAETFSAPFDPAAIAPAVLNLLTARQAARFGAVPLRRENGTLHIALAEPLTGSERALLERLLAAKGIKTLQILYAPISDIAVAIRHAWGPQVDYPASLAEAGASDPIDLSARRRAYRRSYVRLGDILVRQGAIDHRSLQAALKTHWSSSQSLGAHLVASGLITQQALDEAIATQQDAMRTRETLAA